MNESPYEKGKRVWADNAYLNFTRGAIVLVPADEGLKVYEAEDPYAALSLERLDSRIRHLRMKLAMFETARELKLKHAKPKEPK